jgi:hypothetical protein
LYLVDLPHGVPAGSDQKVRSTKCSTPHGRQELSYLDAVANDD